MKRDLVKDIQTYKEQFEGTGAGAFYVDDLRQIRETAGSLQGADRDFELITNALQAGFMIGYRKAKNEREKANG